MKVHERMPKELYYLSVAESVSARSTCINKHYGAIIVSKDRIVGTGYNGSPRGLPNCSDIGKCFRLEHNIPRGTHYETCLACDTVIKLLDGTYRTISDLAEENPDFIWVYAVDTKTGAVVPAKAKNIRKTGHVTEVIRVWFKDRYVDCTPDHRFLLRNGKYEPASELKPGDSIMGYPHDILSKNITKIETVTRECDVYDMEVPKYHNFAVDLGDNSCVFVHNCKSIHAEANCIISATYDEMYDSTMYIYGYDCVNQKLVENPDCCMMCKRLIINAGIKEVIFADEKGIHSWSQAKYGYRVVPVRHWIDNYDPDKCDY